MMSIENSSTVNRFLDYLRSDIETRVEAVRPVSPDLVARIELLANGISVHFNERIFGDVHL